MAFSAIAALLVQAGLGMVANLYVSIPAHHAGAHPGNYFSGSLRSVGWAIAHGATSLAIHAALGVLLVFMAISVVVRALSLRKKWASAWSTLALLLIIAAGFNGASFLDFNSNISSLLMALFAFGAAASYAAMLF